MNLKSGFGQKRFLNEFNLEKIDKLPYGLLFCSSSVKNDAEYHKYVGNKDFITLTTIPVRGQKPCGDCNGTGIYTASRNARKHKPACFYCEKGVVSEDKFAKRINDLSIRIKEEHAIKTDLISIFIQRMQRETGRYLLRNEAERIYNILIEKGYNPLEHINSPLLDSVESWPPVPNDDFIPF